MSAEQIVMIVISVTDIQHCCRIHPLSKDEFLQYQLMEQTDIPEHVWDSAQGTAVSKSCTHKDSYVAVVSPFLLLTI